MRLSTCARRSCCLLPFAALVLGLAWGLSPLGSPAPGAAASEPPRWSHPAPIDPDPAGATQGEAALALDSRGGLHALWVDGRLDPRGNALFYAQRAPGESAWSGLSRVAGGQAGVARAHPGLAIDAWGGLHAVWAETRAGEPDIRHSLRLPGARGWSAPARVNDDPPGAEQSAPAIAADGQGNVHLVWEDARGPRRAIFHARRDPGGAWSRNQAVHATATGEQREPAIAAVKTGDVFAAWRDTRSGASAIHASRLPPSGDVWWPDARLDTPAAGQLHRSPALAADSRARLHALWIEETGRRLFAARLDTLDAFWQPARPVYRAARGHPLELGLAGGPGGQVLAAWSESRPGTARLYAALLPEEGGLSPERVDGSAPIGDSRGPIAAIDRLARGQIIWQGRERGGPPRILHAQGPLPRPDYPLLRQQGWLQYRPSWFGCRGDGFVTIMCDGSPGPFIQADGVDLIPFLGAYVEVTGFAVEDTACAHLSAFRVSFAPSPCPRQTSAVTGRLLDTAGAPIEGAWVELAGMALPTGSSGRFFFDGLSPGSTQQLTATLACALPASTGSLRLSGGLNQLPAGTLVPGEVIEDGVIDLADLVRVADQYKTPPPYFPACSDLDGDGRVGFPELALIRAHYGLRGPTPWQGPASAPASGASGESGASGGSHAPGGPDAPGLADASGAATWLADLRRAFGGRALPLETGAEGLGLTIR